MGAQELMALSLILSIGASGAGLIGGVLIERISDDPRLRDAVWGGALWLGLAPVVAVGILVLTPAPVREAAAAIPLVVIETAPAVAPVITPDRPALPDAGLLARLALGAAGALCLARLIALALRTLRLARMIRRAEPAGAELRARIERIAARLGVPAPPAVVSDDWGDALLSGLGHPRLILPASGQPAPEAVIAHELAHLKRGDHRTLWLEEALAVLLAFNPVIPWLRARRDAAREEACDALALTGAETEARRAYAQTLIQALRDRAGSQGARGPRVALTFTGAGRTTAMHRLNAVMTPAAPAGRRTRWAIVAGALGLLALTGGATAAVAGHRAVEVRLLSEAVATVDASEGLATAEQAGEEAARQAAATALAALPEDAQRRFARPSAADYQRFCASADPIDDGFCAGVMFSHLSEAPRNGLCLPGAGGDERARLTEVVARGKAEIARLAPRRDEGAYQYSERALARAFPCADGQGEASLIADGVVIADGDAPRLPAGVPDGGARLHLSLETGNTSPQAGDLLVVRLTGEDAGGARYENRSELSVGPEGALPDVFFIDLAPSYFPTAGERRAYQLTAEIRRADQAIYASRPADLRLAPGSQHSVSRLHPVLTLAPL